MIIIIATAREVIDKYCICINDGKIYFRTALTARDKDFIREMPKELKEEIRAILEHDDALQKARIENRFAEFLAAKINKARESAKETGQPQEISSRLISRRQHGETYDQIWECEYMMPNGTIETRRLIDAK